MAWLASILASLGRQPKLGINIDKVMKTQARENWWGQQVHLENPVVAFSAVYNIKHKAILKK